MRPIAAALVFLCLSAGAAAAQPPSQVVTCHAVEADGTRTLCHEVVVPAPAAEVWALWATSDGVRSWIAPVAAIDAREGGALEASYDAAGRLGDPANIVNRIVAIEPGRMLTLQVAQAPPAFPHAGLLAHLRTEIELDAQGQATRTRVRMMGFGAGAGFDELYAFFDRGNAVTLDALRARVTAGPRDWSAPPGQMRDSQ